MTAPSNQRTQDLRATLAKTWPPLFDMGHAKAWPPLAVGIFDTVASALHIEDDAQGLQALRRALAAHARSLPYLKALSAGRTRQDLDGNPAGTVTPEQRAKASAEVKARKAERKKQNPPPPGKPMNTPKSVIDLI